MPYQPNKSDNNPYHPNNHKNSPRPNSSRSYSRNSSSTPQYTQYAPREYPHHSSYPTHTNEQYQNPINTSRNNSYTPWGPNNMPSQGMPEGKPKLGFGHKAAKVNSKLQVLRTIQLLLVGMICFSLGIIGSSTKAIIVGVLLIALGVLFFLWDIHRIKELKAREHTMLMQNPPQQLSHESPSRRVPPQQQRYRSQNRQW